MASSPKPRADPDASAGAAPLLEWFDARQRDDIAWRGERDPYAILVAEVMAQQTRVETAVPYHRRFMDRFPDVQTLAEAEEDEVLSLWEGLGYYARARNLRRAARRVVSEFDGRIPHAVSELRKLPGVGPYTAGAVASVAFGLSEPAVDGNARRVLSRLGDLETASPSALDRAARTLLGEAPERPGDVNQALMDLGSGVCTPRRPRCGACPLSNRCLALRRGTIGLRPPRKRRARSPERVEAAAVVRRGGRVLVLRRPSDGLLGGLWDFPSVALSSPTLPAPALARVLREGLRLDCRVGEEIRVLRHTFSHFRLRLVVHWARWRSGEVTERQHRWVGRGEFGDLAFPVYLRRLIDEDVSPRKAR
ncbi:A/G-specific adenine glycosylase [Candidatus Palauibacter soopunensis]|uniref:A/G-specific adenine glycosylase n=1 Tax=Candidatus Palauibacter soopunensis TaxID=3056739 RepID=UPI00239E67EE|nr:A/G-specific adenine glycosylase [Candidatus Palauibacter soopunensis]MDE2877519.1 A/G-specific adenine glycosylase [Candidatus Palauibacter soopunensis]